VHVAEAVGAALAELGGRHAFGLVGSGNFAATNALVGGGVRFVPTRHEGAAITMTDVYSRLTGEVGVCTVHQGPGLTNAMTGLAEAAKSRTPLVLLAAEAAAAAVNSNFRIDQDGLVTSVGALAERVHGPATVSADVGRAVWRARVERRPVVLMLPLDVQSAECEPMALAAPPRLAPVPPAASAVREAATALAGARRPLLVAGRGAVLAGAREPLERLGDRLGALLATSAVANGLFADSPWALGISGGFASPFAAELIASSDAVLAVGATLNMWTTRHGRLLGPDAIVVQVDAEAAALGAHHRVDVGVVGDAAETAAALLEELDRREHRGPGWRTPELRERLGRAGWRDQPYADAGTGDRIDPRTVSIALDAMLPAERTVAVDSGHFMGWPSMYLRVPDPQGFVFTQGFQSIGLGLAGAIAAALARPDRLAVAALGDGGALMAASELETVARLGLRMLVVVYNDAAYGAEVHHFGPQGGRLDAVRFPEADLAALARGAGLEAATVRRPGDLAALEAWLRRPGDRSLLLDAKVVPDVVAEWLEEAFRGH
jgi:thiamine pyrophosphate-dependent acetolactate synthase large subunit-like protein